MSDFDFFKYFFYSNKSFVVKVSKAYSDCGSGESVGATILLVLLISSAASISKPISSNISWVVFSSSFSRSSTVAAVEFGTPNRTTLRYLVCLFFCSHPTSLKMFNWFSEIFFLFPISTSLHSVLVLLLFELFKLCPGSLLHLSFYAQLRGIPRDCIFHYAI